MIMQLSSQRSAAQAEISLDRIAEIYRGLEEKNPEGYENYKNASSKILSRYGAKFLVRGDAQEILKAPAHALF